MRIRVILKIIQRDPKDAALVIEDCYWSRHTVETTSTV